MRTWIVRLLALAFLFCAASASAQNLYSAYINSDNDAATGCTIALPGGTFAGADWRVQATVTPGAAPQVTNVTLSQCVGGTWAAATPIGGGSISLNTGVDGTDSVEFSAPGAGIVHGGAQALSFGFTAESATGSDVMFTTNGGGGGPIVFGVTVPAPALGAGALVLMALLMLLIARRFNRTRLYSRVLAASLVALCGIALAATFNWNGMSPIATDPAGDATNGSSDIDLRAGFVAISGGTIYLRIDVTDLQTSAPVITSANATTFIVGQAGTFAVTTSGVPVSSITMTCALPGGVTFTDNGNGTGTLAGTPAAGTANTYPCTITASNGVLPDATQNFTLTVANSPSVTTLTAAPNPAVFGQAVTFTATVAPAPPGSGTPTGTVNFFDGATNIGSTALTAGSATLTTNALSVATHSITAQYAGDVNFGPSTSSAVNQVITQAASTTGLTSNANPAVFGQSVTFTATVTLTAPGAGTATGTVTFKDGATTLGTGTLAAGVATFSTSTLSVGTHSITAAYGGDGNVTASTSATLTQTVTQAATTTTLTSSANPSVFGQSVTFTATITAVAPGSGAPTGTVTFKDGATTLGTGTLAAGVATFSSPTLSVSTHSITATYSGDTNFSTSTSATLIQTVSQGATTTALVSGTNPSLQGQSVTFTATVTATAPAAGTPTGSVTFKDGATTIGSGTLSAGVATFTTTTLTLGTHSIAAVYAGDTNFATSTSTALSQVVNQAGTTTSVTSGTNPALIGASVTFTATVAVTPPGTGTPTGNVTFKDGATTLGTGALNGSLQATFTTTTLTAGTHSITAVYAGDANFSGSTSSVLTQTINQAPSITSANSATFQPNVAGTFTVTTTGFPSGATMVITETGALPGGVTFTDNHDGTATIAGTTATSGDFPITITVNNGINPAATQSFTLHIDVPPAVISTTPANGAVGVAINTAVSFTFSKAVNITASAFTLECPVGSPVAFTIAPAPPGGVATFTLTPSANLPAGTTCTATAVATQVADLLGTHMTANFAVSFTTDAAPTVTSTTPASGATNVLATAPLSITFNKAVNVTGTAFTLQCPTGTPVAFTISPAPPGGVATYTLTPSASLPAATTCTATVVASQVSDVLGTPMASNFSFSFTTDTPPAVTSTTPANGATTVPTNSTVSFTFNKAVNVTGTAFTLQCPTGTPVAFTLAPAPPGGVATYTLTPTAALPVGVTCTATAVASQITDLVGTHPAANFSASFTTDTPPSVVATTPVNGAVNVLASTTVTITFDKAVNVTGTAFTLQCPTGTPEAFTLSPAPPGGTTSFTLTPSANLPAGAVCTATVVASQVSDVAAATPMAANFTFSFTIDTPPVVTSTVPANGATSVPPATTLSVTFNKAVNITASAFTLQCPSGTPIAFTISPAPPGGATTFTLTPSAALPADTTCAASVVATQVADLAGTNMAANFNWTFSTPPVAVDDTYPENVIGNVSVNSALIGFSVLGNDVFTSPVTITAFDAVSANGGTVAMTTSGAGAGQFTYNPAAGFTGADSFTYTISNAHGSSTATVHITVAGIIWFINNNAAAGDGRLASPFNSIAAFQVVNDGVGRHPAPNANIFVYDSATGYTGPLTLLNGQKLIGQDATSSIVTITGLTPGTSSAPLPATGGGAPNHVGITSAGNTVTLGSGNTVWGLTLGNATGTALIGASVGSLKIRDLTINTTGAAASLSNGALDAILNAVSSGGGTHGIALTTTTGSFDIEGGGASDPTNPTKGRTTAKNGGGTITLGSGGTIQNATSSGVLLSNATNVTLRNMTIQNNGGVGVNNGGDGITATAGSSLTLDNDLIQGQTTNNGVHATGVAGIAYQHTEVTNNGSSPSADGTHVWDVRLDECTGTSTAANSLFHNSRENIFGVTNSTTTTLTLTVTNSQFSDTATAAPGNVGLQVNLNNTATVNLSADSSTFLRNFSNGVEYLGDDSTGGSFAVTNSTFDGNAVDINLAEQGLGRTVTFNIAGNTMRQTLGGLSNSIAVELGGLSNATTLVEGKIQNNTIGNPTIADSGSNQGSGIVLEAIGAGTMTTAVTGNNVVQVDNEALNALAGEGSATLNLTATGNAFSVDNASPNSDFGAIIVAGAVAGDTSTLCLHFSGNTDTGNGTNGGEGVALATEGGTPTLNLQGYGGAANNAAQIATFLDGADTDNPTPAFILAGAGTIKGAPANCPTPP